MIAVTVNDRPISAAPVVENGRVLLPLRATAQALSADVSYDAATHRVTVRRFERTFTLHPRIIANRAYVPLRFIAESLGATVGYDGAQHLVRIVDPGAYTADVPPTATFSTPPPVPPPTLPDYGAGYEYANEFSFYTEGARAYYPGDWMHFVLIAPPGGSASLRLCNLGLIYPLSNAGYGDRYEVSVPAPGGIRIANCRVDAYYTSWDGRSIYVPIPLYIGLYTFAPAQPPRTHQPHVVPKPPVVHRPEPTPVPVIHTPPPVVHTPAPVVHTPMPVPVPRTIRTPAPHPQPRPTPN